MSIRINKITRGRFGNKVFQYNNLVQLANNLGVEASCVSWEGNQYFKDIVSFKKPNRKSRILYWNEILEKTDNELKGLLKNHDLALDDPSYALHNTFYRLTNKDPREFLELKEEYVPKLENDKYTYVGIHIRGGDIINALHREAHPPIYYKTAIDYLLKNMKNKLGTTYYFVVCSDDPSFLSTKETIKYLKEKKCEFSLGPNFGTKRYIEDFARLAYCDILINSASTFVVAASKIGKKNKTLIYYTGWINKVVHNDFSDKDYIKCCRGINTQPHITDKMWTDTCHHRGIPFWKFMHQKENNIYL